MMKMKKTIKDVISGSLVLKIRPLMMKKIVFTSSEMAEELGAHVNSINNILKRLVELNIVMKEKKKEQTE